MTMTLVRGQWTARSVLLGSDSTRQSAAMEGLLQRTPPLDTSAALRAFSHPARQAIRRDIAEAAADLLDLDLTAVLIGGWRKHRELRAAGRRTYAAPGTRETVRLATHRITHRSQPSVEVLLGESCLARLRLTLEIVIDIVGLEAAVGYGRLMALHSGNATVSLTLAVESLPVANPIFQLPLVVNCPLGEGIRLID